MSGKKVILGKEKEMYDFMKGQFSENYQKYEIHLGFFEKITGFDTKWDYADIEFYPYQDRMNGDSPTKPYKEKPVLSEDYMGNLYEIRFKNNEMYFAFDCLGKYWGGSRFVITDEKNNKMLLNYLKNNAFQKLLYPTHFLSDITYKIIDENLVTKVYHYSYIPHSKLEFFYLYEYFYEEGKVKKIIMTDFIYGKLDQVFDEYKLKIKKKPKNK